MKDETGKSYGYWKVLRPYGRNKKTKNARWLCECTICGRQYVRFGFALRLGKTRHCAHCNSKGYD